MSTRTYVIPIKGRTIELKLKKDLAKAVGSAIKKAFEVNGNWIEVTGVIGGEEHRAQLWTPFGGAPVTVADPAQYEADCNELLQSLPDVITMENCQKYVMAARTVFAKHLPVDDQRTTPEVHAAEVAQRNAQIKEREDQRDAFLGAMVAKYGDSPDPVEVPEGYTPVVIELNYNDSDSMSDYFDRHHSYGPQYLLALVKGRPARTEKMHRDIIAKYPELSALKWTWNTENYSMGHGNWLESDAVGTAEDVTTYGGHTAPAIWWEVSYGWNKKLYPFRGYAASQSAPSTQEAAPAPSPESGDCGYTLTIERDWTWLKFPCKPSPDTLSALRAHGGHWGQRRGAWYFTRHLTEAEVNSWLGLTTPEPEPEPDPVSQMVESALTLDAFIAAPDPDPVIIPTMEDITEGNPEPAPVIVPPMVERNSAGALITDGLRDEWNKMQEFIAQDPTPSPAPSVEMRPSRFASFE